MKNKEYGTAKTVFGKSVHSTGVHLSIYFKLKKVHLLTCVTCFSDTYFVQFISEVSWKHLKFQGSGMSWRHHNMGLTA
jgi:hypothetical protein